MADLERCRFKLRKRVLTELMLRRNARQEDYVSPESYFLGALQKAITSDDCSVNWEGDDG
jgi:hypothetical protein